MGTRNHDVVPTPLIAKIASLPGGGTNGILNKLAKHKLVSREAGMKCKGSFFFWNSIYFFLINVN